MLSIRMIALIAAGCLLLMMAVASLRKRRTDQEVMPMVGNLDKLEMADPLEEIISIKKVSIPRENTYRLPMVEDVVVVHLLADQPERFAGYDLIDVFEGLGLTYGEMNIFHAYDDDECLFSIANADEPGTFDIDNMQTFSTRGLSLFARVKPEQSHTAQLSCLVNTALQLAEELHGHLYDSDKNLITEQTLEHYI